MMLHVSYFPSTVLSSGSSWHHVETKAANREAFILWWRFHMRVTWYKWHMFAPLQLSQYSATKKVGGMHLCMFSLGSWCCCLEWMNKMKAQCCKCFRTDVVHAAQVLKIYPPLNMQYGSEILIVPQNGEACVCFRLRLHCFEKRHKRGNKTGLKSEVWADQTISRSFFLLSAGHSEVSFWLNGASSCF